MEGTLKEILCARECGSGSGCVRVGTPSLKATLPTPAPLHPHLLCHTLTLPHTNNDSSIKTKSAARRMIPIQAVVEYFSFGRRSIVPARWRLHIVHVPSAR